MPPSWFVNYLKEKRPDIDVQQAWNAYNDLDNLGIDYDPNGQATWFRFRVGSNVVEIPASALKPNERQFREEQADKYYENTINEPPGSDWISSPSGTSASEEYEPEQAKWMRSKQYQDWLKRGFYEGEPEPLNPKYSGGRERPPELPGREGTSYEPDYLNVEDYLTQIPGTLRQTAEKGYGADWIRSMFSSQIAPYGQQYAKTRGALEGIRAKSGFWESGFTNKAQQQALGSYGQIAQGRLGGITAQNEQQKMAAQARISDIETRNKAIGASIEDWNKRQKMTGEAFDWTKDLFYKQRAAIQEAQRKGEIGSDISASAILAMQGFSKFGPWGLLAGAIPWLDNLFGG